MLRRDLLRSLTATPLAGWLRPWMPAAFRFASSDELNAAVLYKSLSGWGRSLESGDRERVRNLLTIELDDPQIVRLIQRSRPILETIRKAATLSRCDWGIEILSPNDLGKDHLDPFNVDVIRVACLSARRLAREGRAEEALDHIFAGLTFAHRIGTGGLLIARILECGGEVVAFRTLGGMLPRLDHEALADLSRRLEMLPPPEPPSASIGPESRFILSTIRTRFEAIVPGIEDEEWGELGFDEAETTALKRITDGDRVRLFDHLDATRSAFHELARRVNLPRPGCRDSLDEFARSEQPIHPIASGFAEKAWGIRHMVDRMRALRAILQAGLVLIRDGEAHFGRHPDPFGTGPFHLERRGQGYLIRSALADEGKPEVSLEIGETR